MKKRLLIHFLASLATAVFTIFLYYNIPDSFQSLDNRLRDFLFLQRGPIPTTNKVAIVDIDEASLKVLGQWPWNRKDIAQVIYNLAAAGASVIGLDMVFAEEDKKSDAYIIKKRHWKVTGLDDPEDYDAILGYIVANTPTVTGYVWNMTTPTPKIQDRPNITAQILDQANQSNEILEPKGITLNIPKIQDNAYSSGFFNNISDSDGIIRRVPLLMKEDGFYYTSLALEMYRIYKQQQSIRMLYDEGSFAGIELNNTFVPTDQAGRFFVNFRGPQKSFPYISAIDIYNGNFDPKLVAGKAILIGTSAIGLLDIRTMPFDTAYPGVEVHANVIDNLLAKDFISVNANTTGIDVLLILFVILIVGMIMSVLSALWSILSTLVLAYGLFEFIFYMHFSEHTIVNILFPFIGMILIIVVSLLVSYIFESRTKELIKAKFAQKVSPDVVEELLKNPDAVDFAAQDKEITVFFSDVRSFTSISEKLGSAERLIDLMNDYMTPMTDIVMEAQGTVDKFIGDAIMAYWNAPKDLVGHQDAAVRASLTQLKALIPLNETVLKPKYDVEIRIGIGLNTGVAIVGEMGSHHRSDYTAIGDPINLGSRLEGLCKPYGVTLIISEFTKAGLKDEYIIRDLDLVRVKGKELPVAIFEVIDFGKPDTKLADELNHYQEALALYRGADFIAALNIFESLKVAHPDTKLYTLYTERCEHFIENPPVNFDGVFTFTTK